MKTAYKYAYTPEPLKVLDHEIGEVITYIIRFNIQKLMLLPTE
jgi:hypothetical protein